MKSTIPSLFLIIVLCSITAFSFGQFGTGIKLIEHSECAKKVLLSDVNSDGALDLIALSRCDQKILWFERMGGDEVFGHPQLVTVDQIPGLTDFQCGDLDNDGDMDIIASAFQQNVIVWFENSDGFGSFSGWQLICDSVNSPLSIYLEDLDNDGDLDILSTIANTSSGEIVWIENTGSGSFGNKQIIATSYYDYYDLCSYDLDNDGYNDIIFASEDPNKAIAWYKNDGSGNFILLDTISTYSAKSIDVVDLDFDGDLDVMSDYWYENIDGLGTFILRDYITGVGTDVKAADMDSDGDYDFLAAWNGADKIIWIEDTSGNGDFGIIHEITTKTDAPSSVLAYDIDNDNDVDVFSSSYFDHKIAWYENDSNGVFGPQNLLSMPWNNYFSQPLFPADIDSDNDMDLLTIFGGGSQLGWLENKQQYNTFNQVHLFENNASAFAWYSDKIAKDIDGDNDPDLLMSHYAGGNEIAWFENMNGNGDFGAANIICDTINDIKIGWLDDMDNDGDIDVICYSAFTDKIYWFSNLNGNGNYSGAVEISTSPLNLNLNYVLSLRIIDINNDNWLDVVAGGGTSLIWFENTGAGVFGPRQTITSALTGVNSVRCADIDGDNDNDIVVTQPSTDIILWLENSDGLGTFGTPKIISDSAGNICSFHIADLDGDFDNDILSAFMNTLVWYENLDGMGTFSHHQIIDDSLVSAKYVHAFDYNNDGDLDIFSFSNPIFMYENYYNSQYKASGTCFYDLNLNKIKESFEPALESVQIVLNSTGFTNFTNANGEYMITADTGSYVLTFTPFNHWHLVSDSSEYHVNLTTTAPVVDSLDFGFFPDSLVTDIALEIISGSQSCDQNINYWVNYFNIGTTTPNGIIELILDDSVTFISAAQTPDSVNGQRIYWSFNSLDYTTQNIIPMMVQFSNLINIGDTLISVVNIYATGSNGLAVFNDTIKDIFTCSYVPNNKVVTPTGIGNEGYIDKSEILEYTVRFQNTGNDTVVHIMIRDQIDHDLDISSIQMFASSHPVDQISIEQNRWLVFRFNGIMLPDSTTNFHESQGLIKYNILIDPSVVPHTQIRNKAEIYFDNNSPVITNTVLNTIECYYTDIIPDIYETGSDLVVNTNCEVQWLLNDTMLFNATDTIYTPAQNGNYSVIVTDVYGCTANTDVYTYIGVGFEESNEQFDLNIYPNPTTGMIHFQMVGNSDIDKVEVLGIKGNLIYASNKLSPIDLSRQAKGIYFVKVVAEQGVVVKKVVLR